MLQSVNRTIEKLNLFGVVVPAIQFLICIIIVIDNGVNEGINSEVFKVCLILGIAFFVVSRISIFLLQIFSAYFDK